ncbi:hypothetical protein [Paenibacillus sp. Soil750]|uniref:hypothetical protein n=1 Tax=Paenibacillus sp. Soil750 TaxID=1736398 RepID=UPI0006F344AC|nr:hypothetical protein [Paenibacillus sp. Soil750]KRE70876.1 hypothetical protein ASL11_11320 [Paenibacillus sp. Soil750]
MFPLYGKISVGILCVTLLFALFFWNYYKKREIRSSTKFVISSTLVLIMAVCFFVTLYAKDEKHTTEINNKIKNMGGVVVSIQSTEKSATPFTNWDRMIARPKDDYFKVIYTIQNQNKTAWFKGDNALYKEVPTPEKEKWIFE